MKVISTTNARKHISDLVSHVAATGEMVAIGRHSRPEVLLVKFPGAANPTLDDITNFNANFSSTVKEKGSSEYSLEDLKKR